MYALGGVFVLVSGIVSIDPLVQERKLIHRVKEALNCVEAR